MVPRVLLSKLGPRRFVKTWEHVTTDREDQIVCWVGRLLATEFAFQATIEVHCSRQSNLVPLTLSIAHFGHISAKWPSVRWFLRVASALEIHLDLGLMRIQVQ